MKRICRPVLFLLTMAVIYACHRMPATANDETFDYREIYLPYSFMCDEKELGLNCVDRDWAIWGHNLSRVVPEHHSNSIYANVGGNTVKKQFCFSSPQLLIYISKFIDEEYGANNPQRFAILPNDNDIVCQCARCRELGCTPTDASPAVFALLDKLAGNYPKHTFFTSYYLTTKQLPKAPLPDNVGVLVSAMDYPLSAAETPQEQKFEQLLKDWSSMCRNVYVWDYINNFDDYYTPFPIYTIAQRRLQLYARSGVKGVFLNGSGHDYSTYNRINTYVLAALLSSPDANWREVLTETCRRLFPTAGETLARFRMEQEDYVVSTGRKLPLYDGVAAAVRSYLPKEEFLDFYGKMERLAASTTGSECSGVNRILRAVTLTRLELMRLEGITPDEVAKARALLARLDSIDDVSVVNMNGKTWKTRIYSESYWTVDSYIEDYNNMLDLCAGQKDNLLLHQPLTALSRLDEDYSDLSVLTDGMAGLPSNYHCGQLLSSADPSLNIALPAGRRYRRVRVGLTTNIQFRIALPLRVTLSSGGREIASMVPSPVLAPSGRTTVEFDVPAWAEHGTLVLRFFRNPEVHTMAIDEIEAY